MRWRGYLDINGKLTQSGATAAEDGNANNTCGSPTRRYPDADRSLNPLTNGKMGVLSMIFLLSSKTKRRNRDKFSDH